MIRVDILFRDNPAPAQHMLSSEITYTEFVTTIQAAARRGEWLTFNDADDDRIGVNMADVITYAVILL